MGKLIVITREGKRNELEAQADSSIMQVIRAGGLDELLALCGGNCSCATCHVYIDDSLIGRMPALSSDEDDLLDSSSHRTPASRLACQVPFTAALDGLEITIAPED